MTALLDRLERKGGVRRTRDTEDRRRVLVEIAPDLRERAAELYGTPEEGAAGLASYSDEQPEFLIEFRGSVALPGRENAATGERQGARSHCSA